MKFHHLARHNQFVSSHQQQREMSPIEHQLQQQLQQTANQLQRQQQSNNNLSDDEDEDYNESHSYYDSLSNEHNRTQQQVNLQGSNMNNSNNSGNNLDPGGFLVDKNKKLFPQKLWELIHNPSIQHCLRWSQDGQRVYLNRNEFEAYYLKTPNNQFHTQKAISFVRQMNMYGFRKVDDCYYENDNFRRDHQHLLRNMIRRHPNKGLFVGLDHEQLAAAAAAQQALQVNQQLLQFESQHKQRAEQALRLNSYLSNHHQFHPSLLSHAANQLKHCHSSQFEHMSSQLAQVAANHLSQQHHHLLQGNVNHSLSKNNNNLTNATNNQYMSNTITSTTNHNNLDSSNSIEKLNNQHLNSKLSHQPRKSRLLNNFYASAAIASNEDGINQSGQQLIHNQDSMHSTSSVETQPSQCSSALNSGSAGSPQPDLHAASRQQRSANHRRLANSSANANATVAMRTAIMSATSKDLFQKEIATKFGIEANDLQVSATDLSSQSMANREALHQTLVRSLLQLKQNQQPHDLLASLQQQQNSRFLLESLASLSSTGTGSIVDLTSNSPTERTATPPSRSESPVVNDDVEKPIKDARFLDTSGDLALDLAKNSTVGRSIGEMDADDDSEAIVDDLDEEFAGGDDEDENVVSSIDSPLDSAKKVRRFLDNQMCRGKDEISSIKIKRELASSNSDAEFEVDGYPTKKRARHEDGTSSINSGSDLSTRSLIAEICERRGDQLNAAALTEAARYTECFLDTLLEDAALIARHSGEDEDDEDKKSELNGSSDVTERQGSGVIDSSCLSLALKLIPTKLMAAIQQQVDAKV